MIVAETGRNRGNGLWNSDPSDFTDLTSKDDEMPDSQPLPAAFDATNDSNKFLIRIKRKASKDFSWTREVSFLATQKLAYWLYVFGNEAEALEVCQFLGQFQFAGTHYLWRWVMSTLVLESRILRLAGKKAEALKCVERVKSADFIEERLSGLLVHGQLKSVDEAIAEKSKTDEREWSLIAFSELCFMNELGGSETWPPAKIEQKMQDLLGRLREIVQK